MNAEEIKKIVAQNALKFDNGHWFVMVQQVHEKTIKNYNPEIMYEESRNVTFFDWTKGTMIPISCESEEWFQIEAIRKEPANVCYFKRLASDRVWKLLLEQNGEYLRYLKPQTQEMKAYAKRINPENIALFDEISLSDAKELLMQKNIAIRPSTVGWAVVKKIGNGEKELCILPVEQYSDVDFFYRKAIECDINAAGYIVELAKRNVKPFNFILKNLGVTKFKEGIVEFAKSNDLDALKIIFQNPKEEIFLPYIVYLARTNRKKEGDEARNFVFQNIDIEKCWNCIVGLATDGDESAFGIVLNNSYKSGGLKCVAKWALNKDPRAMDVVFNHFDDASCRSCILKLAQSEQRAKAIVYKHLDFNDCWSCVMNLAKNGNYDAIEKVLQNPNRDGAEGCIDYVMGRGFFKPFMDYNNEYAISYVLNHPEKINGIKWIVDLARKGNKDAQNSVFQHIYNAECQQYIIEMAQQGNEHAKELLPRLATIGVSCAATALNKGVSDDDNWANIILLAMRGNGDAVQKVLARPEKDGYWQYIAYSAKNGNLNSKKMVFEHCADNKDCLQCIIDLSEKGNMDAKTKLLELAKNGVPRVIEYILENPKRPGYWQIVIENAQKGDLKSQEIVCQHCFDNLICRQAVIDMAVSGIESAKKTILFAVRKNTNILGGEALSCVIKLAQNGDDDAQKFVFSNIENYRCKLCILKLADKGDAIALEIAAKKYYDPKYVKIYEADLRSKPTPAPAPQKAPPPITKKVEPPKVERKLDAPVINRCKDYVDLGATVVILDVRSKQEKVYRIVSPEDEDLSKCWLSEKRVSYLMYKKVGGWVNVDTRNGRKIYEIVKISY